MAYQIERGGLCKQSGVGKNRCYLKLEKNLSVQLTQPFVSMQPHCGFMGFFLYIYYISGQRNVFKHYFFSVAVCPVIITKFCLRCENMNLYRRRKNSLFITKSTCPNSVVCKAHLFTTTIFVSTGKKILTSNGGQYLQIM